VENSPGGSIRKHVSADDHLLITCHHCQHEFRVVAKLVGKEVPCPHCAKGLKISGDGPKVPDKLIGKQLGGCRLTKRLGAGAIGLVYEAEDVAGQRTVAVKMLSTKAAADESVVKRFHREARLCAQIDHPHVVRVHDCGFDRGVNYLVMELVTGGTLSSMSDERGPVPWQESLRYVRHVALALEHAATLNIVHRDVKPANILVSTEGVAKLADLGLAKQHDVDQVGAELTIQGVAIGSPSYMAPEQIRNARDARAPADIYSLGSTWYHLLSAEPPYSGNNGSQVLAKVLKENPKPIAERVPGLPAGIAELIARMMAKEAKDRPQSAKELLAELDAVEANPTLTRAQRSTTRRIHASERDFSSMVMIGIVVGLVLVVGAIAAWVMFG
jgi:serine/threonine protein kinase